MGTRADFYVGRDPKTMEWLGSIAFDGYPDGIPESVPQATSEEQYRAAVAEMFGDCDDATLPEQGWPWPWDNSATTDYAYAYDEEEVHASCFGRPWIPVSEHLAQDEDQQEKYMEGGEEAAFPDMTDRQAVTLGKRSGLIVLGPKPEE